MACLGGNWDEPRDWWRQLPDGRTMSISGRTCARKVSRLKVSKKDRWRERAKPGRDTKVMFCSGCPAYRGITRDGTQATGLTPDENWYALSDAEYAEWQAAQEATFNDDFGPMGRLLDRLESKGSVWHARNKYSGNEETDERTATWWADYMRRYRERRRAQALADPELAAQLRAQKREQQRRYRAKKAGSVDPRTHTAI